MADAKEQNDDEITDLRRGAPACAIHAMTDQAPVSQQDDNPTRRQIADAVATGARNTVLDTNATYLSLGAVLVEGEPGEVLIAVVAGPETAQGNGVVGGGTLAAMIDSAMAAAVMSALKPGQVCSTISLTVNMLRPAKVGRLFVRAKVERLGGRVAFAEAKLMDEGEVVVASGTSSLAIISLAK